MDEKRKGPELEGRGALTTGFTLCSDAGIS